MSIIERLRIRGQAVTVRLVRADGGAVLVEYALVMSLLSLGLMSGMFAIEKATATAYNKVTNELTHYAMRDGG